MFNLDFFDSFELDDNCILILALVALYFLYKNGCLDNILGVVDEKTMVWVAAIGAFLYWYHKNGGICLI